MAGVWNYPLPHFSEDSGSRSSVVKALRRRRRTVVSGKKNHAVGENHEGHGEHEEDLSDSNDPHELASWVSETDG